MFDISASLKQYYKKSLSPDGKRLDDISNKIFISDSFLNLTGLN